MTIGEKIGYFRKEKGLTVNRLANLSGVSQSYLRDIELGKKQPTVEYLSYICDALGISLYTFFAEGEEERLLAEIGKLNNSQKEALFEFIKTITN